jgi:septal ring factor EnvC (AmiA/AmiB activator)
VKCHFEITAALIFGINSIIFFEGAVFCQDSKELDKKKQDNIQQLNYSKNLLEKTANSKNLTLNQLDLIQHNILVRTNIIGNISEELSFLESDIDANNIEIRNIETKIDAIKLDYAKLIIGASRNLDNDYAMMYIFSSQDFNQAYQRIKYLKYLARYRMELTEKLKNEDDKLRNINLELFSNKKKNERLISERRRELISLDMDKKQNISIVHSLQNKEVELKNEINKRERIQAEIEKEIHKIIEEEAAKAREAKKSRKNHFF